MGRRATAAPHIMRGMVTILLAADQQQLGVDVLLVVADTVVYQQSGIGGVCR